MVEEFKEYKIRVLRVEEGKGDNYKFVFGGEFGEYQVEMYKYFLNFFKPGEEDVGVIKISGMPDFLGEEDKMKNVSTVSYSLERIFYEEDEIWEK